MSVNGSFLDKNGLTYLWSKLKAKFSEKQDNLTFDTTPTSGSSNPVTSNGIHASQEAQETEIGILANSGTKNILQITNYSVGQTLTVNGRTFEVLSDGGIKITGAGAGPAYADFYLVGSWANREPVLDLHDHDYTISVTSNTAMSTTTIYFRAVDRRTGTTAETATVSLAAPSKTFSMHVTTVLLTVQPAANIPEDGIIVYPMIRRAEITDATFAPYAPTNRELYEMILALQNSGS